MRVFLDSNILFFSGLDSSSGAPARIMDLFARGELEVVISQQVLEEVTRSARRLAPQILPALESFLVASLPEIVADPDPEEGAVWSTMVPPEDACILASACSAATDYFITGDKHLFRETDLGCKCGVPIVTPAEFLALIQQ